jgi:glucose-6-phosphate 1-dehydrogenase
MKHPIQKFVLFGATGDLSQRYVWPSLYHLCREKLVPPTLTFVGSARHPYSNDEFRKLVEASLRKNVLPEFLKEDALADLLTRVTYAAFEASDGTAKGTEALQKALAGNSRILYFMATSPKLYGPTCMSLAAAGLAGEHCRVVLEKPIGTDLASSVAINEAVGSVFHEDRIYRIDHYLGKEAVQNLLALRFANSLFEPLWNASNIDHVQITVGETVGLEGRWGYYDESGALRDMLQNHVLQLVALVAMEPPHQFEPNEVRNEKTKVIRSLRPITASTVAANTVRGQYTADLRRTARGNRQLALGGRAVLPAHRQAHAGAPHRHHHPVQDRAAQHLRRRGAQPACQPARHPLAAAGKRDTRDPQQAARPRGSAAARGAPGTLAAQGRKRWPHPHRV